MKLIVKQILCIKLVKYRDKYTEMDGQQNVKILLSSCKSTTYRVGCPSSKCLQCMCTLRRVLPLVCTTRGFKLSY